MKKMDPNLSTYQNIIRGMNPVRAQDTINKLHSKIERAMAAAHRRAYRVEDSGPVDQASERMQPLQTIIMALEWFKINGASEPTGALKTALSEFRLGHDRASSGVDRTTGDAFPDLVGKTITFRNKQKVLMTSVVVSQRLRRKSGEMAYKTANGWKIPHRLILSIAETPKTMEKALDLREMMVRNSFGKTISWRSRRLGTPEGRVTNVGRTKVTVEVPGSRGVWRVPFSIITKVDGVDVPALV